MIEVYSQNVTVVQNQLVPFNIVALRKGTTIQNSGSYELVFNQCGVYELTVSATVTPVAAATETDDEEVLADTESEISIQLVKDGVAIPQAQAKELSTSSAAISFTTLVQVNRNNTPYPCSRPVICSIRNTGVAATFNNIDVVVTKIV